MTCPKCKSDSAHRSHRRGLVEHIAGLFAIYPYRCRKCENRFLKSKYTQEAPPTSSVHASTEKEIRRTRNAVKILRRRRELLLYGGCFGLFLFFLYYITRERGPQSDGN
jgi:hypothetical protein